MITHALKNSVLGLHWDLIRFAKFSGKFVLWGRCRCILKNHHTSRKEIVKGLIFWTEKWPLTSSLTVCQFPLKSQRNTSHSKVKFEFTNLIVNFSEFALDGLFPLIFISKTANYWPPKLYKQNIHGFPKILLTKLHEIWFFRLFTDQTVTGSNLEGIWA